MKNLTVFTSLIMTLLIATPALAAKGGKRPETEKTELSGAQKSAIKNSFVDKLTASKIASASAAKNLAETWERANMLDKVAEVTVSLESPKNAETVKRNLKAIQSGLKLASIVAEAKSLEMERNLSENGQKLAEAAETMATKIVKLLAEDVNNKVDTAKVQEVMDALKLSREDLINNELAGLKIDTLLAVLNKGLNDKITSLEDLIKCFL